MKDGSDARWKAAWRKLPASPPGDCPPPGALAADPLDDGVLDHLAGCAACREDIAAARASDPIPPAPAALRQRLHRLLPRRTSALPWIAAAAAVVVAAVVVLALNRPEEPAVVRPSRPAPAPVAKKPEEVPAPKPAPPAPEPLLPLPAPKPVAPPPDPKPEPKPAPQPAPAPEKPAPTPTVPEKPAPEPTRVALKGSLLALAGTCSAQSESEAAAQALRLGQRRDFAGTVRLKADVAAAKIAMGTVTLHLQRGAELSLLLEEGRTLATLARGEAFFDVAPGRFSVETAHGRIDVKGTRFLVSAEKTETEALLQTGSVEFTAAGRTVTLAPGERSAAAAGLVPSAPQKADLAKRLAWLRALEDTILIDADQMVLQGGMAVLPDAGATGGRAIGIKGPLKAGQEASAEAAVRRKQPVPYAVWVRLHWSHGVPATLALSVGDSFTWSAKAVTASPQWQWVRAGTAELPDERFRVRLTDTHAGLRVDQILLTSDPERNPESK